MSRYQRMPVKDLIVDDRYQREVDEKRVEKIVGEFNPNLFGVLEVNQRNGKAAVFDGQHRLAAARALGMDKVPCMVHADLSPQDEAMLFVHLQQRRKNIQPVERFKARLFAGEPVAVEINDIVQGQGFAVAQGSSHDNGHRRHIAAVGSLEAIHARGNLGATLGLLEATWGGDDYSTEGNLLNGLSLLQEGYGHRLDEDAYQRLRQESPVTVLRRVRGRVLSMGGRSGQARLAFEELRKIAGLRGAPRTKREEDAA